MQYWPKLPSYRSQGRRSSITSRVTATTLLLYIFLRPSVDQSCRVTGGREGIPALPPGSQLQHSYYIYFSDPVLTKAAELQVAGRAFQHYLQGHSYNTLIIYISQMQCWPKRPSYRSQGRHSSITYRVTATTRSPWTEGRLMTSKCSSINSLFFINIRGNVELCLICIDRVIYLYLQTFSFWCYSHLNQVYEICGIQARS